MMNICILLTLKNIIYKFNIQAMKILRFNEGSDFPEYIRTQLEKYGHDKVEIKYYVASASSRYSPSGTLPFTDLETAFENLKSYCEDGKRYWIFESKLRPLTQEEINLHLDSKKYNL